MSEVKNEDVNSSLPVAYEDDGTDYWQSHLDSWVQSGLSQAAYCRRHDLDRAVKHLSQTLLDQIS